MNNTYVNLPNRYVNRSLPYWLILFWSLLPFRFVQAQQHSEWHESTTVYQIYPLSYQDSDGDGTGDIKGIISRLNYLQILGVQTLWISPVYPSPWADHGYDISHYKAIHPRMGSMADFDSLVSEAKKRNMRIVMDLVMNHTSNRHPWFEASRRDKPGGRYRNMYVWKEGKKKPNNWKSMTGGSGWHYDEVANAWYWASFLGFQPDLNYHNPAVKDSMFSVMDFWIGFGVDGFRLDIFNCLAEDSLFRNNPPSLRFIPSEGNPNGFFQQVKYTQNTETTFQIAREFRQHLDSISNKQAFSVGEVFGSAEILKSYTGEGKGLHSVFLFKTMHAGFNAQKWYKLILENEKHFKAPAQATWVLSNHDKKRFISRIGNREDKMRALAFMQFTLRGIPFIYMGEELGMRQQKLNPKYGKDPIVAKYGPGAVRFARISGESLNRDECRTPMAWTSEKMAGFTSADSAWLPIAVEADSIYAEKRLADKHSIFHQYRKLISMRNALGLLNSGLMDSVKLKNKLLSYRRYTADKSAFCYINFSGKKKEIKELPQKVNVIFGELIRDKKGRRFIPAYGQIIYLKEH